MQLYDDCPSGERCGPWRPGIDIRLCVRCGREVPDTGAEAVPPLATTKRVVLDIADSLDVESLVRQ